MLFDCGCDYVWGIAVVDLICGVAWLVWFCGDWICGLSCVWVYCVIVLIVL